MANSVPKDNATTNALPREEFDRFQISFYAIASGIVIVLFVGFVGVLFSTASMVLDSNGTKQATYQQLLKDVNQQDTQIQILTNEIKDLKDFMRNCNAWRTSAC